VTGGAALHTLALCTAHAVLLRCAARRCPWMSWAGRQCTALFPPCLLTLASLPSRLLCVFLCVAVDACSRPY
jgi:hypothetical protein